MSQQDRKAWGDLVNRRALKPATIARSKYGNVKETVDGLTFDSKREAARYQELKMREKAGEILGLVVHPRFALKVGEHVIGHYEADFSYIEPRDGGKAFHSMVEDVKGVRTDIYKWKKKHFEIQYNWKIQEIR